MPGSNMPLATLGTFILWLGWFGFNGASQLAMGSIGDVSDVSRIFANTNLAAAGGVVAAIILTQIMYKKVDVTMALNGALAGLVSITAEPLMPAVWQAILIGAVGGVIVVFHVPLLDKLKIDDVVGAIPVHLLAGIWGTFIVPLSNDMSYGTQILGIVSPIGVFTFVVSGVSGSSSSRPSASVPPKRRDDGSRHGGSRCRSLSGIHQGLIALAMKSRRDGVPSHLWGPVFPGPFFRPGCIAGVGKVVFGAGAQNSSAEKCAILFSLGA
jgi:hypothetical protein